MPFMASAVGASLVWVWCFAVGPPDISHSVSGSWDVCACGCPRDPLIRLCALAVCAVPCLYSTSPVERCLRVRNGFVAEVCELDSDCTSVLCMEFSPLVLA